MNAKNSDPTPDERAQSQAAESSSLGPLLRRAREARGLSLRDISDQTRISRRYLEAIEADDYKNLPGGIFNRSFVKAFAKAIGFDEAQAIRAYERTARAQGEPDDVPTSRQASRIYTDGEPVRSPLVTIGLSVLILAVISLGAYAALHWYQRRNESRASQPVNQSAPAVNANTQGVAPPQQATPTPAVAAQGLNVQVKAKGEEVWLRTKVDAEPSTNGILAADQTKELTATDTLSVEYSPSKANALEMTINGRPAVVPTTAAKGKPLVQMLITKADYARLLQQP